MPSFTRFFPDAACYHMAAFPQKIGRVGVAKLGATRLGNGTSISVSKVLFWICHRRSIGHGQEHFEYFHIRNAVSLILAQHMHP
jgi:hypothetical protein